MAVHGWLRFCQRMALVSLADGASVAYTFSPGGTGWPHNFRHEISHILLSFHLGNILFLYCIYFHLLLKVDMIIGGYPVQGWSSTTAAPGVQQLNVVPVLDPETDGFEGKV